MTTRTATTEAPQWKPSDLIEAVRGTPMTSADYSELIMAIKQSIPSLEPPDKSLHTKLTWARRVSPNFVHSVATGLDGSAIWQQSAEADPQEMRQHLTRAEELRPIAEQSDALNAAAVQHEVPPLRRRRQGPHRLQRRHAPRREGREGDLAEPEDRQGIRAEDAPQGEGDDPRRGDRAAGEGMKLSHGAPLPAARGRERRSFHAHSGQASAALNVGTIAANSSACAHATSSSSRVSTSSTVV
jgi:hypothetical protein